MDVKKQLADLSNFVYYFHKTWKVTNFFHSFLQVRDLNKTIQENEEEVDDLKKKHKWSIFYDKEKKAETTEKSNWTESRE